MQISSMFRPSSRLFLFSLLFVTVGHAQQITFPDFSSINGLQLNGSASQASWSEQNVLRLTNGATQSSGSIAEAGSAFFGVKQPVAGGFTTYFQFQMHNPTTCCFSADGIAFVVHNANAADATYGATGGGAYSLGVAGGGIGYTGIPNSLAVEFDVFGNQWDPEWANENYNANHVAVQSCGTGTNTPVHDTLFAPYSIGQNTNVPVCLVSQAAINQAIPHLAGSCGYSGCSDGSVHTVVIEYTPPPLGSGSGNLKVWIDPALIPGTHTPTSDSAAAIDIPYTISDPESGLSLDENNGGSAWVGFTASQGYNATAQDILTWEFTPHVPSTVTLPIANGGITNIFPFGSHNLKVTYPTGFTNTDGTLMQVTATPVSPSDFQSQRLAGTPFANEQCIVYEGTGGNCVVYSVRCLDPSTEAVKTCPSEPAPTIDVKTSYDTVQNIVNPDFLKADPIGSNNWISIFDFFQVQRIDGTTGGKAQNFSDLVATFGASAPVAPSVSCTPPSNPTWSSSDVFVPCTATTIGELVDPSLASFTLNTSVAPGTETNNAFTNSVQVCDIRNLCSTVGPYSGFKVDKKPPVITVTTPASNATYPLGSAVKAAYSCTDGGSGVQTCTGDVPVGAKIDTTSPGSKTFTVNATDNSGNQSLPQIVNYNVGYGNPCLLYFPNLPIKRGLPVPLWFYLCDANKQNVSSPSIRVRAVQLVQATTGKMYPITFDGDGNADDDFQYLVLPWPGSYYLVLNTMGFPAGQFVLYYTAGNDPVQHSLTFQLF